MRRPGPGPELGFFAMEKSELQFLITPNYNPAIKMLFFLKKIRSPDFYFHEFLISTRISNVITDLTLLTLSIKVVTICTTRFNIQESHVLHTECTYGLCVDLRRNSDYFLIHGPVLNVR